jgi:amino acid adenylation domain-containing protein
VQGDDLIQVVEPRDGAMLPWHETGSSADGMQQMLAAERERPFDRDDAPLWRVLHFREGDGQYLYFIFHHAITDEWSTSLFFSEFRRLLEHDGDPVAAGLLPNVYGYADFSYGQLLRKDGPDRQRLETFWRERLSDLSGMMRLTPDFPVSNSTPGRLGRISFEISAETRIRLQGFAGDEGLSHFVVFLSALQILLYRMTGEDDILIGTPVSERDRAEWHQVMGYFLNTIPVRVRPNPGTSFRDFSRQAHDSLAELFDHAALPFSEIASLAGGADDIPFNAILQVMFILLEKRGTDDATESMFHVQKPGPAFVYDDLVWLVDVSGDEWTGSVKFDASRYSAHRMEQFAKVYRCLLGQIAADPDKEIGSLELMDEQERASVLALGRGESRPLPQPALIHGIFEWQVLKTPDARAMESGGHVYSYDAINRISNRWAHHLTGTEEVKPSDLVAILLPRGEQLVFAILAVLKSGAACLPIDPGLPPARIRFMLEDTGCRFLMGDHAGAAYLPTGRCIDVSLIPADLPDENLEIAVDDRSPAYCMYTSGSTGQPKGTFNEHAGFVNMILSHDRHMGIRPADRILHSTSPSFDVSLYEIFTAFFSGSTLVIADKVDLSVLPSFIVNKRVSVAMLTPMVAGSLDTDTLSHLRVLITGGEEARPSDAARLSGKLAYHNTYGPTEVSVWSTIHHVGPADSLSGKVPIGRPVDNTRILVMDARMRLLPAGMTGEVFIGGIGVGRGYHARPDMTAERFPEDPFHPGERLYRTGDMAYWNGDGNLVYVGRKDTQMKVMGYRIEPGEVIAALEKLPGVLQAAIIPRQRAGQESMLVAFVVTDGCDLPGEHVSRTRLAGSLPSYMLPARIHRIESIPLTHTRKVDTRRLAEIDEDFLVSEEAIDRNAPSMRPQGPTETALAAIWTDLLGTPVVGRDDNFFSLGGHSLQLIRLMVRVNERWGIPVDVSRIYTRSTLRSMAELIDEEKISVAGNRKESSDGVVVWNPGGAQVVHVMVGGAGSVEEYTKYHRIGEILGEGYEVRILPDPSTTENRFPHVPMDELARTYAASILQHRQEGPFVLLGDCVGGIDAFATACELQRSTSAPVRLIMMDALSPVMQQKQRPGPSALELYRQLPESASVMTELLFGIFLKCASLPGFRQLFHWTPASRRQVELMAAAYGLFDSAFYARHYPVSRETTAFSQYLASGREKHYIPSDRFNPFRYRKHLPDFNIGEDDPVLHALLIGMRIPFIRRKILSYGSKDQLKSDLISARSFLRRERFRPGIFRGDVDLVVSSKIYEKNRTMGWEKYVGGELHTWRTEGDHRSYLREHLPATASLIRRLLEDAG